MAGSDQARQARLEGLRRQIAKAASFSTRAAGTIPLGIDAIDSCLGGGLARGALHEVAAADHRSIPAALGFLLTLTHRSFAQGEKRLLAYPPPLAGEVDRCEAASRKGKCTSPPSASLHFVCSAPPPQAGEDKSTSLFQGEANILWPFGKTSHAFGQPYAPGLKFFGLDPARIVFVRCATARECLWAMEEGLRLGGIAAVIGARAKAMDLTSSRRLQLAAEQANTPVFLLRSYNDGAQSAAVTRWRVAPAPSARDQFGFTKNARFHVALDYARGGKTGEWVMEWDHDALRLRLSSALGDRAAGENRAA
jgi:protein ImuA